MDVLASFFEYSVVTDLDTSLLFRIAADFNWACVDGRDIASRMADIDDKYALRLEKHEPLAKQLPLLIYLDIEIL